MKRMLLIILLILVYKPIYPQDNNKPFPEIIDNSIIYEYINNINDFDGSDIKTEYILILDFIDSCIDAFFENIDTYFSNEKLIRYYPAIKNGKLSICVDEHTNYVWDNKSKAHKVVADIDVVNEVINIIHYMYIYNYIIENWNCNNNELLGDYKNIDDEIVSIQKMLKNYEEVHERMKM
jgi:hypothetical protein